MANIYIRECSYSRLLLLILEGNEDLLQMKRPLYTSCSVESEIELENRYKTPCDPVGKWNMQKLWAEQ